jgi:hypothetical protein
MEAPDDGPAVIPAAINRLAVVTVTVTWACSDPSRVTDDGENEHAVPGGLPVQARETAPRKPPLGVMATV